MKLFIVVLCLALLISACDKQSSDIADKDSASIRETSKSDALEKQQTEIIEVLIISDYDGLIKEYARKYGFDWLLISAQIFAESSFNPEAVSRCGALGLMQIMPSTAKWLGTNPELLIKPEVNIELGCYYNFKIYTGIKNSVLEQEKLTLMLASFNAGPNRVKRLRSKHNTWDQMEPHLPKETRTYVLRIWNKYSEYSGVL